MPRPLHAPTCIRHSAARYYLFIKPWPQHTVYQRDFGLPKGHRTEPPRKGHHCKTLDGAALTLNKKNTGSDDPLYSPACGITSQCSAETCPAMILSFSCLPAYAAPAGYCEHTMRNLSKASSSLSSLIRLKVGRTLLQGPHHAEYSSTTANMNLHPFSVSSQELESFNNSSVSQDTTFQAWLTEQAAQLVAALHLVL